MAQGDDSLSFDPAIVVEDLRSALVFLTRLPPRLVGADPTKRPDFRRGARVFPLAGALIGAFGAVALGVAVLLHLPPFLFAATAVAATVLVTGGLHEDGLADTADSFGGATTERKLAIMDDSRVGAYGSLALIFSVLLRVGALTAIGELHGPLAAGLALIAAEAASRGALVRLWHDLPAARMSGLSHETGPPDQNAMVVALALAAVIVVVAAVPAVGWRPTLLGSVLAAIATYVFTRLTARAIGGRTGDSLGACQQIAAVAFLIGAAAY
jgi:adenosylcobinamide-GDP ribazoletransferase